MKIFDRFKKATMTEREKLLAALKANPVCSPMNNLREMEDTRETELDNGDGQGKQVRMWLNPNNQSCFNSGWFTFQDFYDWIEGKGKIVKGGTDEEKLKFWEVAKFQHEHYYAWAFLYYKKYFNLIDDTYHPEMKPSYGFYREAKTPLKITKNNHAEIIAKMMGNVCRYYGDTTVEPTADSHMFRKMHDELNGVKETLYALGVGYYGANNTPEEPENLAWIADICVYKAAYLYYVKNGIELPDFEFVDKNRYTKF
jgi:hypothetical protein